MGKRLPGDSTGNNREFSERKPEAIEHAKVKWLVTEQLLNIDWAKETYKSSETIFAKRITQRWLTEEHLSISKTTWKEASAERFSVSKDSLSARSLSLIELDWTEINKRALAPESLRKSNFAGA